MIKKIISMIFVLSGFAAQADINEVANFSLLNLQKNIQGQVGILGLQWKVGESATYDLTMGGFIKGSSVMRVREDIGDAFWLDQQIDLGFMGKQNAEILIDKNTGAIREFKVNGQPQEIPAPGNTEIEETKEDRVTVPAGTFDCIYARIKDLDKNETSEAWINPAIVPIMGMIKQLSPGPMGKVEMVLRSFQKM